MVAIIGGALGRFRPLVDLYWEAAERAGHDLATLKVGVHSPGYVAATSQEAGDKFFPGFAKAIASVAKERGWGPLSRPSFDAQRGPDGVMLVGDPEEVAEKILRHSEALGGIERMTFQMNASSLPHATLMKSIELIGSKVAPAVRKELGEESPSRGIRRGEGTLAQL
jgi:alkanesulfonate monooxygenase SsuD/methylene tetrahydromethanopterin reductase-like flavin-dependent oxidoreductase (luciferase family)